MSEAFRREFEARSEAAKQETFGPSVAQWDAAWRALHDFAKASDAPLGSDVVKWLLTKTDEYHEALYRPPLAPASPVER